MTTQLNLVFQRDTLNVSEIQPALTAVIDTLLAMQNGELKGHPEEQKKNLIVNGKDTTLFDHKLQCK